MDIQKDTTITLEDIQNSPRGKAAMDLFMEGYNCSQAVTLAFADLFDMDRQMLLRMSSSFGGGMGRLREVCGAVSGMFIVVGFLYGYEDPKASEEKAAHYSRIQELARRFKEYQGSIVCRELLGLESKESSPVPEKRTEVYYQKRPCPQIVGIAAMILEQYLAELETQASESESTC